MIPSSQSDNINSFWGIQPPIKTHSQVQQKWITTEPKNQYSSNVNQFQTSWVIQTVARSVDVSQQLRQ